MSRSQQVHHDTEYPDHGYCGTRDPEKVTRDWRKVTCPNCLAAHHADEEARS